MNEDERPDVNSDLPTVPRPADATGQIIAGYRVLQMIGEGGMGVVYEAEQEQPVRRRVALKLIKPGMDTGQVVARFESERQALALMSHPSIASIYDGGATEAGRPYFAMELVHGEPLSEYCDKNRLTIKQRLELFIRVCDGVQHAHQKGIIHRDLKPSNILVTIRDEEPVPKIIDFGVAKAISSRLTEKTLYTQLGQWMGTPVYMSPEQAEMTGIDVDTRSDVYSLGVVLYELLAGALPFDPAELKKAGFEGFARVLRQTEPKKPSTRVHTLATTPADPAWLRRVAMPALEKELRGDLDWITMKALEKDRTRRYGSVSELAADIKRHLCHEPVLAGPPSAAYRVRKFVRRHRFGVAAAAMMVLLLVGVAAVMAVQAQRVARERDRANREAARASQEAAAARQVSDFLVDLFHVSDPSEARGRTITAREILAEGAARVERDLAEQPLNQARLMTTIGRVYMNLGLYGEAEPLLNRGLAIRRDRLGDRSVDVGDSLQGLGDLYRRQGRYAEAEGLLKRALAISEQALGPEHPETASTLHTLGVLYDTQGRFAEAESCIRRSLEIRQKTLGLEHRDVARSLNSLGVILWNEGKQAEAEPLLKQALAVKEKTLGFEHPDVAATLTNLAILYESQKRFTDARPLLLRALDISKRVYGSEHPLVAESLNNLAALFEEEGDYPQAATYYGRALRIWEKALGPRHSDVGIVLHNMANLYRKEGRAEEAEQVYLRAQSIWEASLGPKHPYLAVNLRERATLYREMARWAEAESLYKQAIAIQEKVLGLEHPELGETLKEYALLLRHLKRDKEAQKLLARASGIEGGNPDK